MLAMAFILCSEAVKRREFFWPSGHVSSLCAWETKAGSWKVSPELNKLHLRSSEREGYSVYPRKSARTDGQTWGAPATSSGDGRAQAPSVLVEFQFLIHCNKKNV